MKQKAILFITFIWALVVSIHESGLIDLMPIENEKTANWIKVIVLFAVLVANAFNEKINLSKHVGPRPPKPPGE